MTRFDETDPSVKQTGKKTVAAYKAEAPFVYEDIVNTQWPRPDADAADGTFREHMSLDDRAKIFAPFAALKGFEEAIDARAQRNSEKFSFS